MAKTWNTSVAKPIQSKNDILAVIQSLKEQMEKAQAALVKSDAEEEVQVNSAASSESKR